MADDRGNILRGREAPRRWEELTFGPYEPFPSRRQRISEFWLMRTFDPTVRTALTILRTLILSRLGDYMHPDEAVQDEVREALAQAEGGAPRIVGQLLSALWAGFAVVELGWGPTEAGGWGLARTELLHPLTFFPRYYAHPNQQDGIVVDPSLGRVAEFRQLPQASGEAETVFEPDEVLYWPVFAELREQVYGASLLEAARPIWYARVRLSAYWNTYCEKLAMPTPLVQSPVDTIDSPDGSGRVSAGQFFADLWAQLQPGQALVAPYTPGQEWKVDALAPAGDGGAAFARRLDDLDAQMWAAMLTPRLLMIEPEHGSRAQSSTSIDLFLQVVDGIRAEIGSVLVHQLARQIIATNRGALDDYGEWAWQPLADADLERLARVLMSVEQARSAQAMRGGWTDADDRHIREVFSEVLADPDEAGPPTQVPDDIARRYGVLP